MMAASSMIGLLASGLMAVTIGLMLMNTRRFRPAVRGALFAVLSIVMVIPVDGLVVAGYVRGIFGDPSITTVVLLTGALVTQLTNRRLFDHRNFTAAMILIIVAGVLLYPMTLGLTQFDPYALGYGSYALTVPLFAVALIAWQRNLQLIVICILLAVLACLLGPYESTNLWDYLTDGMVTFFAAGWALLTIALRVVKPSRPAQATGVPDQR